MAGSWYPASAPALRREVEGYLDAADEWKGARPIALVSPHAGYRFSGPTAAYGYRALRGQHYRTVFLIGPSHRTQVRGVAVATDAFFETPLGAIAVNRAVADALRRTPTFQGDAQAHAREHSLEIQLPLLQVALSGSFSIVPLLVGELEREQVEQVAKTLRSIVEPEDLVIASSDFTHYGPTYGFTPWTRDVEKNLAALGEQAWTAIDSRSATALLDHKQRTGDTICGALPIAIVLAMQPPDARAHRLRFETSGRVTGAYDNSVSYLSVAFTGSAWNGRAPALAPPSALALPPPSMALGESARRSAHQIARRALELWVRDGTRFDPEGGGVPVDDELRTPLGVFVTLKEHGALRGCIGNILPNGSLHSAIAGRAIDAAQDPRFEPVRPDELDAITIEISVLTRPVAIGGPADIVLGRDGVILRKAGRSAVFLPQVAPEQGWNVDQMLTHLARKAGLQPDDWRTGAALEAFQAVVF